MSLGAIIGSALATLGIGVVLGLGFGWIVGDKGRREYGHQVAVGIGSAYAGWLFGLVLPIAEYKFVAVVGIATFFSMNALHIYWVVFKERTNLMKDIDSNWPLNEPTDEERPSHA